MKASESVSIASLPVALHWRESAESWKAGEDFLELRAGPSTDLFVDPAGGEPLLSAPSLVGRVPEGDFLFSARVVADQVSTFDAGVLLVYRDPERWAKLCLERSPQGEATIVSVVTRGVSDDCNSFACPGKAALLRIARIERCLAFHASTGEGFWRLVRYFDLGGDGPLEIGFLAQSPTGAGCTVRFEHVAFEQATLGDIRNGE
jgi:regulation of enolase protein 1 (concanavalin A-like superfamily)